MKDLQKKLRREKNNKAFSKEMTGTAKGNYILTAV